MWRLGVGDAKFAGPSTAMAWQHGYANCQVANCVPPVGVLARRRTLQQGPGTRCPPPHIRKKTPTAAIQLTHARHGGLWGETPLPSPLTEHTLPCGSTRRGARVSLRENGSHTGTQPPSAGARTLLPEIGTTRQGIFFPAEMTLLAPDFAA